MGRSSHLENCFLDGVFTSLPHTRSALVVCKTQSVENPLFDIYLKKMRCIIRCPYHGLRIILLMIQSLNHLLTFDVCDAMHDAEKNETKNRGRLLAQQNEYAVKTGCMWAQPFTSRACSAPTREESFPDVSLGGCLPGRLRGDSRSGLVYQVRPSWYFPRKYTNRLHIQFC